MSSEQNQQHAMSNRSDAPGAQLAAQRQAMGWTVEQIADQLKLAPRQVAALEAGDYASLPNPAVVRGFVRAYAKVVKLDPAPLVAMIELDNETGGVASTSARRDKPASFSEVRFPSNGPKRARPLVWVMLAIVIVLGAGVGLAYQKGLIPMHLLQRGETPAASAPPAPAPVTSTATLPSPVAPGAGDKAATGQMETTLIKPDQELKSVQNNAVPLISVPPQANAGNATPGTNVVAGVTPAAATNNALVLDVRHDSWVEIRPSSGGAPLIARLVKGGSVETFDINEPVLLIVSKPSEVAATLRGSALELKAATGYSSARVSIK